MMIDRKNLIPKGKDRIAIVGFETKCKDTGWKKTYEFASYDVEFVDYADIQTNLDSFSGIIYAYGSGEGVGYIKDFMDHRTYFLRFDPAILSERDKQLVNASKKGAWCCYLLDSFLEFAEDGSRLENFETSDLAKLTLKRLNVKWRTGNCAEAHTTCHQDEFKDYNHKHSIGLTSITLPASKEFKALIKVEGAVFGFAFRESLFFLPFQFAHKTTEDLLDVANLIATAATQYKLKNAIAEPEWLSQIHFQNEADLKDLIAAKTHEIEQLSRNLQKFSGYKTILTTSGDYLVSAVREVIESYFGFKTSFDERFIEDIKLVSDNGTLLAVAEIKGFNNGVTREHVNQVDTHRERNGLGPEVKGILFVNDSMKVDGLEARLKITVHPDISKRAQVSNISIVRTTDLLTLMLKVEEMSVLERKQHFLKFVAFTDRHLAQT